MPRPRATSDSYLYFSACHFGDHARLLRLIAAIDKMELLLSHATQAGIVVSVDRIEARVKAKRAARNGIIDEQVEITFWHEFQELGQQLLPISVDSLKATRKGLEAERTKGIWKFAKQRSLAGQAVRRYQIWSVVALLLLLVTQIYTIFGSNAVNDIQLNAICTKIQMSAITVLRYYPTKP